MRRWMAVAVIGAVHALVSTNAFGDQAGISVLSDAAYKTGPDLTEYEASRCKLDVYLPAARQDFPTLIWLHGGGLTAGKKEDASNIARLLAERGVAVVVPNYRLSAKAPYPAYIDDSAAAVAWTVRHIAEHGGRRERVFLGGHSAGAYLVLMVGLNPAYLEKYELQPGALAGLIPVAGQTLTHYTIREERGLPKATIIADEAAPLHHVKSGLPPLLVVWAEHDMEMRAEENLLLVSALKAAGQKDVRTLVLPNRHHGTTVSEFGESDDQLLEAIVTFVGAKR